MLQFRSRYVKKMFNLIEVLPPITSRFRWYDFTVQTEWLRACRKATITSSVQILYVGRLVVDHLLPGYYVYRAMSHLYIIFCYLCRVYICLFEYLSFFSDRRLRVNVASNDDSTIDNLLTDAVIVAWIKIVHQWHAKIARNNDKSKTKECFIVNARPIYSTLSRKSKVSQGIFVRCWQSFHECARMTGVRDRKRTCCSAVVINATPHY